MKALGIDPGLAKLGFSLVERADRRPCVLWARSLSTSPKASLPDRLRSIWDSTSSILRAEHPDVVCIEDQAGVAVRMRLSAEKRDGWQASNARVDEVVGLLKGCCLAYGVPYLLIAPQSAKIALLGRGSRSAKKSEIIRVASLLLPGVRLDEHAADAVANGLGGLKRAEEESLTASVVSSRSSPRRGGQMNLAGTIRL